MAETLDWSPVDNNNTDFFPEGQAVTSLNDGGRGMQGAIARHLRDISGNLISAGSGVAYTLTVNRTVAALAAGLSVLFKAHVVNTGAATLRVGALAAKPLVRQSGAALVAGDIAADQMVYAVYVASSDHFRCLGIGDREVPESYTLATLPAASLPGRLAYVSDALPVGSVAVDTGSAWEIIRSRLPVYTVTGGSPTRPAATTANKGLLILVSDAAEANQVQVSSGTAWLSVKSDLHASYTTAALPTVGNAGRVVYDSTIKGLQIDDGTAWRPLHSQIPSYTVATLPSASGNNTRTQIYVSNESGGAVLAFSDGTNWRRVTDRAVVS